ncbi:MAG: hypothetical protein ABI894_02010 [Ilumatobacteraceae bacterium]
MSAPPVEQMRATAGRLRALAATIGTSRALTVYRRAGTDTWIGPTPQRCDDALLAVRRQLQSAQQATTDTARRLERQADTLQHQLVSAGGAPV